MISFYFRHQRFFCDQLGVVPATITRQRSGQLQLALSYVIRIHERASRFLKLDRQRSTRLLRCPDERTA